MTGQTMNFKAYYEQLKTMSGPVPLSEFDDFKYNLRKMHAYAKEKGVSMADLTDEEREMFYEE